MLRRIGILSFGLCLIGALSAGCGSDHQGPQSQEHTGAAGGNGDNQDQQTATAGADGFAGGSSGVAGSTAGGAGSGPTSGASVQFVLKEVH
jgi:hypothetical protein